MYKRLKKISTILRKEEIKKYLFIMTLTLIVSLIELVNLQLLLDLIAILTDQPVSKAYSLLFKIWSELNLELYEIHPLLILFMFTVLSFSMRLGTYLVLTRFAQSLRASISSRLLKSFLVEGLSDSDATSTSDKIGVIISETDQLVAYVIQPLAMISGQISIILAIITFMLLNLELELVLFVGVLPVTYVFIGIITKPSLAKISTSRQRASLDRYLFAKLAIDLVLELTSSGKLRVVAQKFMDSSKELARNISSAIIIANSPKYILEFFVFSTIIALSFAVEVGALNTSETNLAAVTGVLLLAAVRLLPSIQVIYQSLSQFRFGAAALDKVHDLLNSVDDERYQIFEDRTERRTSGQFNLDVSDVSVYLGSRKIIHNFNYSFKSGQSYHLKGVSGSGKSTFLKCVAGVGPAYTGSISAIDSQIVGEQAQAKKYIVPQNSFLGSGTLRNILTFYSSDISDTTIYRALSVCCAEEFLKAAKVDLDTVLNDADDFFSGGQCQRLALARAIIHVPDILLMDEGLSGVEVAMETEILNGLRAERPDMVFIFASHREPEILVENVFIDK